MTEYLERKTPCWLFSPDIAVANFKKFSYFFENAAIAYAFKSNPHPALALALRKAGAYFCVVSQNHLRELMGMSVPPEKIVYSHVIKSLEEIRFALKQGVRLFACDSFTEIDKLAFCQAQHPTGLPLEIFVRLDVDNSGSLIPLSGKFGVKPDIALELMHYARRKGFKPVGFTFHIGSQCLDLVSWQRAIGTVAEVWKSAREAFGINLLNIGGGFAAPYENGASPPLKDIAVTIRESIQTYLPGVNRLILEPGRAIAATAGSLLTSVTGIAERPDGQTWLFIDAGVFNGLFETLDGIRYPVTVLPPPDDSLQSHFQKDVQSGQPAHLSDLDEQHTYMLAGPTCDSLDKLFPVTTLLPIKVGDRLLLRNTGAYGYSLECVFNGYPAPAVKILEHQHQTASDAGLLSEVAVMQAD